MSSNRLEAMQPIHAVDMIYILCTVGYTCSQGEVLSVGLERMVVPATWDLQLPGESDWVLSWW